MTPQLMHSDISVIGTTSSTFLPLGGTANAVVGLHITPVMVCLNNRVETTPKAKRGLSSADRAARISANPERSAALRVGRQRLAAVLSNQNPGSGGLSSLRLAAGLSQAELASLMDMQQPNIARLEKRPGDPTLSTILRLARALSVTHEAVIAAIESTNKATAHE